MKMRIYFFLMILIIGIINFSPAQTIDTEGIYKNYGSEDYECYLERYDCKNLYDLFGNYMLTGRLLVNYGMAGSEKGGNDFFRSRLFAENLGSLMIIRDEFEGTNSRLMLGQEIATNFTSLTIQKPQYNGFRWDINNDKLDLSLLTTVTDFREENALHQALSGSTATYKKDTSYYLLGGRSVSHLGDLIKVGLTWLDQYNMDTRTSLGSNSFKGIDPDKTPKKVERAGEIIVGDITGQRIYGFDTRGKVSGISFECELERNEKFFDELSFESFKKYRDEMINENKDRLTGEIKTLNQEVEYLNEKIKELESIASRTTEQENELKLKKGKITDYDKTIKIHNNVLKGLTIPKGYADVYYHLGEEGLFSKDKEYNFREDKGITYAGFFKLKTDIKKFTVGLEKYRIDPYYSFPAEPLRIKNYGSVLEPLVSFSSYTLVDDNDDKDRYPDEIPYAFTIDGSTLQYNVGDYDGVVPGLTYLDKNGQLICVYDINQNGIPDYKEDFFLNYIDPPEYNFGYDRNNNGLIDAYENDRLPDYPYPRNIDGQLLSTNYYFDKLKTKLEVEYKNEKEIIGEASDFGITTSKQLEEFEGRTLSKGFDRSLYRGKNTYIYLGLNHESKINWLGNFSLYLNLKKVKDDIPNDCIEQLPFWEEGAYILRPQSIIYTPVTNYFDDLLLAKNSLILTEFFQFEYTAIKNFKITTKFKNETNQQKDINNTIEAKRNVYRIEYKFKLADSFGFLKKYNWSQKFAVMPSIKYITLNVSSDKEIYERTRSSTIVEVSGSGGTKIKKTVFKEYDVITGKSICKDENKTIFVLMGIYELSEHLKLVLGMQKRKDVNHLDDTSIIEEDFTGDLWSIQIIQKVNYKGYDIAATLGFKNEKRNYKTLQLDEQNKISKELIFLKFYLGY